MTPSAVTLTTTSVFYLKVPAVVKIVYSTCSIHAAENEDVVDQALRSEEAQTGNFRLAPRECALPTWTRRGIQEHLPNGGKCATCRIFHQQPRLRSLQMRILSFAAYQATTRQTGSSCRASYAAKSRKVLMRVRSRSSQVPQQNA
jgi:hypothetical protein